MSIRAMMLSLGAFFLLQFIFFSFLVHKDIFTQFDFNTTVKFQDKIPDKVINEFSFLSEIGKFEVTTIVLIVLLIIVRRLYAGIIVFASYVGFHVIEVFGKWFVDHPPPPQFMLKTEQLFNMSQFHVRSEFSYPSGHSGRAVFLAILFIILVWQIKRFPLVIKLISTAGIGGYVVLMLVSRIYLGEHWTTDVIGGSLLGAAMGCAAGAFLIVQRHKVKEHGNVEKKQLFPKYKVEIKRVA